MQILRVVKKFRQILNRRQKVKIVELVILMVIGGFLEMCSVSLILPFMETVLEPDKIMSQKIVIELCGMLGIRHYRTFLVFLALLLASIYIIKNVFLIIEFNIQNRFIYSNQFEIQKRLLHNYVQRPYEYFLDANMGEILRVINTDTRYTFILLANMIQFFTELIVSFALVITVFVITPLVTVIMSIMILILLLLIMAVVRPIMRKNSIRSQKKEAIMNRWLMQSIYGIKEIKVTKKENYFEEEFCKNGLEFQKMNCQNITLSIVPRYLIEAVSMSSFLLVIAFILYKGALLEDIIPILSVVAMAAIRLLPSANRISQCMGSMAQNEPYLDKMIENLKEVHNYTGFENNDTNTVQIGRLDKAFGLNDIQYKYPTGEKNVLEKATLEIKKGETVGIVGSSGSGKTTTIDLLLGLLRPQDGCVVVDGTDISLDKEGWLSQIGYIPQSIFMLDGSIRENVAFGVPVGEVDEKAVVEAIRDAALLEFVESLPEGLDTKIGERGVRLSGGQRQRIGIARALYTNPSILFLDEATSALDNETEAEIMDAINKLHGNKTIVIIAHRLSTIEGCDHVFRVENKGIYLER